MKIRLPNPPDKIQDKEVRDYLERLVKALEGAFEKAPDTPFTRDRIKVAAGLTKQYTLDPVAGTLADVRSVVATLLTDLQVSGKIS